MTHSTRGSTHSPSLEPSRAKSRGFARSGSSRVTEMNRRMKRLLFCFVALRVVFFSGDLAFCAENNFSGLTSRLSINQIFKAANSFYQEAKYDRAILEYEKIITQGLSSGNLYYNLANCYFKKGDLGKAVLNYERAKILMPADSDLKANYDYARSLLNLGSNELYGKRWVRSLDKLFSAWGINSLTIFLSLLWAIVFLVLILGLFFEKVKRALKVMLPLITLLLLSLFISFNRKITCLNNSAVVINQEAQSKFEPLESATTYFTLSQGSLVEVIETTPSWAKIRRQDGKIGWVSQSSLGFVLGEK